MVFSTANYSKAYLYTNSHTHTRCIHKPTLGFDFKLNNLLYIYMYDLIIKPYPNTTQTQTVYLNMREHWLVIRKRDMVETY